MKTKIKRLIIDRETWEAVGVVALFLFFCFCYKCWGDIQKLKPV